MAIHWHRFALVGALACSPIISFAESYSPQTHVSIEGSEWRINGEPTHAGSAAEGLLMNVRIVNSTFEDRNRDDFDPGANTARFLERIAEYAAHGVLAFTLNLQGGMPGYEGALNSAFEPDGSLRPSYMERIARVIEACDQQGIIIILGLFYQRQDQVLESEDAVRRAVVNAVEWVTEQGYTNVILEIANEFAHPGFNHSIIRTAEGQVELIGLAKQTAPGLLTSTSGLGNGRIPDNVAQASDFILIHYNNTSLEAIPERIEALKHYGKPIVCNEDDKVGEDGAKAAELSVQHGASWGFMHSLVNQYEPFEFKGAEDDPAVYEMLKRLTSP